ncbi:sulfatase-like hydrolase/transferase [Flavobacteriaceae bacterium S356]|uniref:Sulfatase-like hydrolase/transferase n=1 Tax=Asprobacillus argus TaxID=3076534 RepID=A0ABU3LHH4_9FLAO|nr:sulfatase-like hydrolase/transferase [Flavobacteriaceae bacterium S356]
MKYKSFFFYLLLSLLFANCGATTEEIVLDPDPDPVVNSKPNILLVIADDFGKDATPNYSEGTIKPTMSTLQSLINTGVTFDNVWSYPVCTPTRASILTGKYGVKTNVLEVGDVISTAETSVQQYIATNTGNEYATAIIGKWHLSLNASDPITMGIDYYAGLLNGGVQSYTNWNLTENGQTNNSTVYTTTKFTDLAIDWVGSQTKPWFLWLAYNAPHTPFHLAPTNLHSQGNLPTDQSSIDANPTPYFMSAVEAMDSELGRLLSSLSTEERNNTILIFIGDNGTPNQVAQVPYSAMRAKGSIYQGGVNVPMIVSGFGVNRMGERESALVHTTDLFATIASMTGVSVQEINNSTSFYNLLADDTASERTYVYTERSNNGVSYAIRDANYKLIVNDNGTEQFYRISTDPYEGSNLIGTTLNAEAIAAKAALEVEAENIRN